MLIYSCITPSVRVPGKRYYLRAPASLAVVAVQQGFHSVFAKKTHLVPKMPDSNLKRHAHIKRAYRGIIRLNGARGMKQVWRPHVRTWGLSDANALHWRKYLWHCWGLSAPPAVIQHSRSDLAPPSCITKHRINNKTRQKHRFNTIPSSEAFSFPVNTLSYICFLFKYRVFHNCWNKAIGHKSMILNDTTMMITFIERWKDNIL